MPRAETWRPVWPSGFHGIVADAGLCAISAFPPAAASVAASMNSLRVGFIGSTLDSWLPPRVGVPGVFRGGNHFLYFGLLHVQRELVRQAGLRIVKFQGHLIQLEAAVRRVMADSITQSLHFLRGHWLKAAG